MREEHTEELFRRLPDEQARTELVELYQPLAIDLAQRYAHRGQERDDLVQVALLGLLNAIDRYDPEYGSRFISFAVPTITGELKRYFRDVGWGTGVPRRMKDVSVMSRSANEELAQRLGRSPTVDEIARHIDATPDEVAEAAALGSAYRPEALDAPNQTLTGSRMDILGEPDRDLEMHDDLEALRPVLESRPARERKILYLRFYQDMTQRQIAEVMGISQMHVSRIISSSLEKMRLLLQT